MEVLCLEPGETQTPHCFLRTGKVRDALCLLMITSVKFAALLQLWRQNSLIMCLSHSSVLKIEIYCVLKVRSILCCRLYNKDAIIEYLLDKTAERPNADAVAHIRGIKVC